MKKVLREVGKWVTYHLKKLWIGLKEGRCPRCKKRLEPTSQLHFTTGSNNKWGTVRISVDQNKPPIDIKDKTFTTSYNCSKCHHKLTNEEYRKWATHAIKKALCKKGRN